MRSLIRFSLALAPTIALAATASADVSDRPFDFTDAFYLAHGINPAAIIGRPQPDGVTAVTDNNTPGPEYRNVRLLDHAACYDHSGHATYFHVLGLVFNNAFTNDAAGQEAREIADFYKIYEFPRAGAPQFSVFPKRQDAIADLRHGYFSNDPLGLWQINIVRFTPSAFATRSGREAMAELAARNGLDLDGTPVITTVSDVENLLDEGYITITVPPADGSALRWFLCPIPEDLTDGTIAPDAHVTVVEQANGLPLTASAEHVRQFHCLQATGDYCASDCRGDIDCNREVNTDDLLRLLGAWGLCPSCLQDANSTGRVDTDDLLMLLGQWGQCR